MAHPRKYDDSSPALERLREVCLALPETTEKEAWGECTFRVGGKMFAMTDNNHHDSGHLAIWIKAPAMVQEILINSDPKRFFNPPYVGHKGWVGARLDVKIDWEQLAGILHDGYLLSAPKRLSASAARTAASSIKAKPARRSRTPRGRSRSPRG
ncbi:MAG: MmcQ/YjbR family DNA-binding protein [Candidatus Binataceae bacterium]